MDRILENNPLLRRAMLFLEESDWGKADDYCEKVLDQEPENAYAYVIKVMARVKVTKEEDLGNVTVNYSEWNSYRNACRYADDELLGRLQKYRQRVETAVQQQKEEERKAEEERRIAAIYDEGVRFQRKPPTVHYLQQAIQCYKRIPGYQDAEARAEECRKMIETLQERERKRQFEAFKAQEQEKTEKKKRLLKWTIAILSVTMVLVIGANMLNDSNAEKAKEIERNLLKCSFVGVYNDIKDEPTGHSWTNVTAHTRCEVTYQFLENGIVKITTLTQYDEEPFIMQNGERQWDYVTSDIEKATYSDVSVSLLGDVTVKINGKVCSIEVDGEDKPEYIEIDSLKCYSEP